MHSQIYVNLPVKDLARSRAFFEQLGFGFNPQFSDDKAACMVVADNIFVMLLTEPFFAGFTNRPVADARQATEVLLALACDSREHVDALVAKAVAAGGATPMPSHDHGFMYQHGFEDLDGHLWELAYMAPQDAPPA